MACASVWLVRTSASRSGESGTFELNGDFLGDVALRFTGLGQNVRVTVNNVQAGQTIIVSVSLNGNQGSLQVESRPGRGC